MRFVDTVRLARDLLDEGLEIRDVAPCAEDKSIVDALSWVLGEEGTFFGERIDKIKAFLNEQWAKSMPAVSPPWR